MKLRKEEHIQVIRTPKGVKLSRSGDVDKKKVDDKFWKKVKDFEEKEKKKRKVKRDARIKKIKQTWKGMQDWTSRNINNDLLKSDMGFDFDSDFDMFGNKKLKNKTE